MDGTPDPLAHPRADGIVIQTFARRDPLEDQAQLTQARDTLRSVRHERDGAGERRAVKQVARRGARRSIETPPAQVAHQHAAFEPTVFADVVRFSVAELERQDPDSGLGLALPAGVKPLLIHPPGVRI